MQASVPAVAVQYEQAVAIGAFHPAVGAHVEIDAGVTEGALAAVAGDFHRTGVNDFGGLRRGCG